MMSLSSSPRSITVPSEKTAARTAIIQHCANVTEEEILGGVENGNLVTELNSNVVVKWGFGVFEQEYLNQLEAFKIVDPRIVRVPKAHDFFTDDAGRGYLVMDLMRGFKKKTIHDDADVEALARILQHFATIKSRYPGPLSRQGPSYALLFGESDHPTFKTNQDLEQWFNHRLLSDNSHLVFPVSDLCLCHLDFFSRNILWETGKPPCLLDWLTAGFWPRVFERCSHMILEEYENNPAVMGPPLKAAEEVKVGLVLTAWRNIQRYAL